ncbi:hypothetical protein EVAR_47812_1 [Eumeta japonica]|uniref:Uncharacterized protein n=1 Tax=Eumeta variegata TaxID=151549 RepID=A0A4C1YZD1_EUMVA|nr:hypothetical protein EVAR_47812_1 [Eumeta japonica]
MWVRTRSNTFARAPSAPGTFGGGDGADSDEWILQYADGVTGRCRRRPAVNAPSCDSRIQFKRGRVNLSDEFRVNYKKHRSRAPYDQNSDVTYHETRASLGIGMGQIQSIIQKHLDMKEWSIKFSTLFLSLNPSLFRSPKTLLIISRWMTFYHLSTSRRAVFKKRAYSFLKDREHTPLGLWLSMGGGDCLHLGTKSKSERTLKNIENVNKTLEYGKRALVAQCLRVSPWNCKAAAAGRGGGTATAIFSGLEAGGRIAPMSSRKTQKDLYMNNTCRASTSRVFRSSPPTAPPAAAVLRIALMQALAFVVFTGSPLRCTLHFAL